MIIKNTSLLRTEVEQKIIYLIEFLSRLFVSKIPQSLTKIIAYKL